MTASTVHDAAPSTFTWSYGATDSAVARLYERGKRMQWNSTWDLDWSTPVDQEELAARAVHTGAGGLRLLGRIAGPPFDSWGDKEWIAFELEAQVWRLSQFLHGEQAALACAAKLVRVVPNLDAKAFAATQVADEARHVEVFSQYVSTKLAGAYGVNRRLETLVGALVGDARWDMTYLGMQVVLEGFALGAFRVLASMVDEPLLQAILTKVAADESRHVAYGVVGLREVYGTLSETELGERQEFVMEAMIEVQRRMLLEDVWERLGIDARRLSQAWLFAQRLAAGSQATVLDHVVGACRALGLLDAGNGWLRERFEAEGWLPRSGATGVASR